MTAPTPFRPTRLLDSARRLDSDMTNIPFLLRLNYGLAGIRERSTCIVDGYWTHTFHFELPTSVGSLPGGGPSVPRRYRRAPSRPTTTTLNASMICNGSCNHLEGLWRANREISQATLRSIQRLVDRIGSLLPDLLSRDRRRTTRGLINFIGDASSYLFGTATESDIAGLRQEILKIKNWAGASTADAERTREGMATFVRLQNQRLDTMREVLDRDQKALEYLRRHVESANSQMQMIDRDVSYTLCELAQYVDLHDGIQELEAGIEDLIRGQLTPSMISVEQLGDALLNISEALMLQGNAPFRLCQASPQAVYRNPSYDFARHGNELFIRLHLPYTRHDETMNVYSIYTFPMKVPGDRGFITQLQDFPKFVVTHLASGMVGELTELPRHDLIESSSVIWHGPDSCAFRLLSDSTDDVHEICRFTASRA